MASMRTGARLAGPGLWVGGLAVATLAALILSPGRCAALSAEGGGIEIATPWGWGLAAAAMAGLGLTVRPAPRAEPLLGGAGIALLLLGRERHWHKAWSSDSVLKLDYYTAHLPLEGGELAAAPLAETLIAGAVVLALASALLVWVVRQAPALWRGLAAGRPAALSVAALIAGLGASKILDSWPRWMADFGPGRPAEAAVARLRLVEEAGELILPALALLAAIQAWRATAASAGYGGSSGKSAKGW